MTDGKKRKEPARTLLVVRRYLIFFLLMAFVITCCMMLFVTEMARTMELMLTRESIRQAATLTMGNVILLSLLCTIVDGVRRKFTVERPIRQIEKAADRIMKGDFSVRLESFHGADGMNDFAEIADYFNKMAAELAGMETLRTDFIANVSHELKTPLAVMQNYGTMLQQPELPDEKRLEYARAVTDASRRLADLITNILKLNKLENQQIFPTAQTYDLGEQLCECLLSFENAWETKELEIDADIEEGVKVSTDAELMSLVWNNLFSNAIKFTEKRGQVQLSLKTEGDFAIVRVSDTGCGIAPEVGQHIFEKFYQGDTSHSTQGNGLGLALVKKVIDIVKGDISVESESGHGSTFTVKLRRKRDGVD